MTRIPKVGPWAKEKLRLLGRYLDYFTTVLKRQPWRTVYVDAFAGGGDASVRTKERPQSSTGELWELLDGGEASELIEGSPRIALGLNNPFDTYVFVDTNGERVAELKALKAGYDGPSNIHVRHETAELALDWVMSQNISKSTHRGVAFLDPFGGHLPWKSVEKLARTGLFEAVINFPLPMALNRLMTRDAAGIQASWRSQLDSFFGSEAWFEAAYQEGKLLPGPAVKREDSAERLLQLYTDNLRQAFGYVSRPRLIRNTNNGPLYFLIWAGPHKAGLKGADYILKMGTP